MSQADMINLLVPCLLQQVENLLKKVKCWIKKRQMAYLSRKVIIEESLQNYGGAIVVKDLKEAFWSI